jgi:hypothetical protein
MMPLSGYLETIISLQNQSSKAKAHKSRSLALTDCIAEQKPQNTQSRGSTGHKIVNFIFRMFAPK